MDRIENYAYCEVHMCKRLSKEEEEQEGVKW